jgi:hypothetical protein
MPRPQGIQSSKAKSLKRKPAFWKAHVKALQTSGLSRAEYCRRNGLSYDAMTYWHSKTVTAKAAASNSIVPVLTIQPRKSLSSSHIIIRFREDFTIEIDSEFDEAVLKRVIRALER